MEADVRGQREQISRWEVRWRFLFLEDAGEDEWGERLVVINLQSVKDTGCKNCPQNELL